MSQKIEKPSLTGLRIKTRKRDEKEKYDPLAFRDAFVQGLNEENSDLDYISKYLDSAGSKLDYRRYSEPLFDILFAGGILAPGGSLVSESSEKPADLYKKAVFQDQDSPHLIKTQYEIFYKLIRRYKYLEKSFDDEIKKLILFLKGFKEEDRVRLARVLGMSLANGLCNPSCLVPLFDAHLVKDGLSLEFSQAMFSHWLAEKDMNNVATALKKCGLEIRLLELLPVHKRSQQNFEQSFLAAGLEPVVDYQRVKATAEMKKGVQSKLGEMVRNEEPIKELISVINEHMEKTGMQEPETAAMVWSMLMNALEWSKKDDMVGEQVVRHLKHYSALLSSLTSLDKTQAYLLQKVQEFCYDNMNFHKVFSKIIILFYKTDVLGEDAIVKWFERGHSPKGKTIFLDQMKGFIQWLQNAEEESDEG